MGARFAAFTRYVDLIPGRTSAPLARDASASDADGRSAQDPAWLPSGIRFDLMVVLLLFVVALALRLHQLSRSSLWVDEAWQVWYSSLPVRTILKLLPRNDTSPPFYYLFLHYWMSGIGRSELAVRLPSALAGALSVPILYATARTLVSRWTALVAAVLLLANPFAVYYSQEARSYAVMAVLAIAAVGCLLRTIETRSWRWASAVAVLDLLLLYTQSTTILLIAAQAAYVIFILRRERSEAVQNSPKRSDAPLWTPLVVAIMLWLPWIPNLAKQAGHQETSWIPYARPGDAWLFLRQITGMDYTQPFPHQYLIRYLVAAIFLLGLVVSIRVGWREALFFLAPALLLFLAGFHSHLWAPRAALFAVFGFVLLLARLIVWLPRPAALLILAIVLIASFSAHLPGKEPWRSLASVLCAHAQAGDAVYLRPSYSVEPLGYYTTRKKCQHLVLAPGKLLPRKPALFAKQVFTHETKAQHLQTWLLVNTGARTFNQDLARRHAHIWLVSRLAPKQVAGSWKAVTAFVLRPAAKPLFQQGGLVLDEATIQSVR